MNTIYKADRMARCQALQSILNDPNYKAYKATQRRIDKAKQVVKECSPEYAETLQRIRRLEQIMGVK